MIYIYNYTHIHTYIHTYIYIDIYLYMMQPSLVPPTGYGYTGAMFPAPWVGGRGVVVVVSRSEL